MKLEALAAGVLVLGLAMVAAADAAAAARTRLPLDEGWTFRQVGRDESYPAEVPGVVHLDLHRNGLIGDPFYGALENALEWIEKTDWEYRTEFAVATGLLERKHLELVFDGLDTYARVYLNGELVLDADNMYRWWRVGVAGKLRPKGNELRIVFRSPIAETLPRVREKGYQLPAVNDHGEKTSVYTRKAPYSFGWDWGPRFVTCGIWKPVALEAWDDGRLVDVFIKQEELGEKVARLTAEVEVLGGGEATAPATIEVAVAGGPSASLDVDLAEGARRHTIAFEIPDPKRWWPNGLGEQPLYTVTTRLRQGGAVVDETSDRIGLRTIELRRQRDEWGKSFEFVVNGVPVFAKGANSIPLDSFLPRVTREHYERLLRSAQRANMNMIRVWAGGIYESDDFYDVADELGLLVWQDFHFSCSLYPAEEAFLANVAVEAEQAIRRLRNHPSLALWNGNNEVETAWFHWGWRYWLPNWLWNDYEKIFHDLLPKVVARHDPTRAYWPSSPSAGRDTEPNSPDNGDMHYWGVWHGAEPFEAYERTPTRFMSEYGFQSFPELKTIQTFAGPGDMAIDSQVMMTHQKHPRGNQLIREYMLRDYPEPKDFASFLYVSQVLQAEGIKIGAEFLRRSRPRTMGSLYWQLNDCWPVASWASLDYFGRWKALHYAARRFYDDILVSTAEEDGEIAVYVVSDLTEAMPARLEAELLDLSGTTLHEVGEDLTIESLASRRVLGIPRAGLLEGRDPDAVFLRVRVVAGKETLSANHRFFVPPKDLKLGRPEIESEVVATDDGFRVTLRTDTLARHVRLTFDPDDGVFTDNYFDLVPGRPVEVLYRPAGEPTIEAFRDGLVVESIMDAFERPLG